MSLDGKTTLVTGAAGFIGSHLVEALVACGCKVKAFVRYNSGSTDGHLADFPESVRKMVTILRGDVRDPSLVDAAVEGCDTVFHLAALISIPYSYLAPRSYFDTNVTGTINVVEACKRHHTRRLVITSTSETYGSAVYTPIDEKHPLQAQSPYAASKIAADKLAEAYFCSYGLPVAIIRPFNTYGPRQSARAILPTIISQALSGNEIRLGSLQPSRDLTFVQDTVDAFIRLADCDAAVGQVTNVGSGKEISIGELASLVLRILNRDKECTITTEPERVRPERSEVTRLLCDNSRARTLLGWQPAVSLEKGIVRTASYIHANLSKFRSDLYYR